MLVYQNPLDRPHTPSILAIGSFDGLHLGHQALLARQKSLALIHHVPSVVYTFDQPTRVLLEGSKYLYTLAEKLKILEHYGVDEVVTVPFTLEFSQRSKDAFLDDLRVLEPKAIVVGNDFRFGRRRSGGLEDLRQITPELMALEQLEFAGEVVKASKIRGLLELGDVLAARAFLGRRGHGVPASDRTPRAGRLQLPATRRHQLCLPVRREYPGELPRERRRSAQAAAHLCGCHQRRLEEPARRDGRDHAHLPRQLHELVGGLGRLRFGRGSRFQ